MKEVDEADYALLAAIADAGRPVWKKRIHTRLQNRDPPLPGNTGLSLQSVGRRINALHDEELVDTVIVDPDDVSQNLIIGYTLTEKGQRMLKEKRGDIINSYVGRMDESVVPPDVLLQMLDDELELDETEYREIQKQSPEALHVFTVLYNALRLVDERLDEEATKTFSDIIRRRRGHNSYGGYIASQ